MKIAFHHKGISLAEDFKPIAEEKLNKLDRFNLKLSELRVDIKQSERKNQKSKLHHVELSAWHGESFLHAKAEAFNDLAAFDKAIKNFQLQLRKMHERIQKIEHKTIRRSPNPSPNDVLGEDL